MEISKYFDIEYYTQIVGLLQKSLRILPFSCMIFSPKKIVLLLPDRNVSIPLDKNISILLASNINNGNIETFWYKELYMKDLP